MTDPRSDAEARYDALEKLFQQALRLNYAFAASEFNGKGRMILDGESADVPTYTTDELADMCDKAEAQFLDVLRASAPRQEPRCPNCGRKAGDPTGPCDYYMCDAASVAAPPPEETR